MHDLTKINTTVEKTSSGNTIVVKFDETPYQLEHKYSNSKWITNLYQVTDDGRKPVGVDLKYNSPSWELNTRRDPDIKKLFMKSGLIQKVTEGSSLLEATIMSMTDEIKADSIIMCVPEDVMPPTYKYIPGVTHRGFIDKMKEHFYINDEAIIIVTLSTMLTHFIEEGDPVWLYIVGPPSGLKTESVRGLTPDGKPNIIAHPISNLTPRTFISGMEGVVNLVERINGKIVIFKDWTSILSKPIDVKNELYGQLREIHDGFLSNEYGTGEGTKGFPVRTTIIAAVTPVLDSPKNRNSACGDRFIRIRINGDTDSELANQYRDEVTLQAVMNDAKMETKVRTELSNYLLSMLMDFKEKSDGHKPEIIPTSMSILGDCARITSVLRTDIEKDFKGMIISRPEAEFTPRLVGMYKKEARALAWLLGKDKVDDECLSFIYRITLDGIEKTRLDILKTLSWEPQKISEIVESVRLPEFTVENMLEELWMLEIIKKERQTEDEETKKDNRGNPWFYSYNEFSPTIMALMRTEFLLKNEQHHYKVGVPKPEVLDKPNKPIPKTNDKDAGYKKLKVAPTK